MPRGPGPPYIILILIQKHVFFGTDYYTHILVGKCINLWKGVVEKIYRKQFFFFYAYHVVCCMVL